jgi:hypothetical protein
MFQTKGEQSLSPNDFKQNISKVTVPIAYRKLIIPVAEIRQRLAKQGKSAPEIEKAVSVLESVQQPHSRERAMTIVFLGIALLSQSAQRIYLIDEEGVLTNEIISELPNYLRSRIFLADTDRKIRKSIAEMTYPIYKEINPLWEKMVKTPDQDGLGVNDHEHGLCILNECLTTLAVAVKYNTEADVDLNLAQQAVNRLRLQAKSAGTSVLLSRIEGILNCYHASKSIPSLKIATKTSPTDLLKDLLDDSKIISLSESRFLLGIPSKAEIALIRIRQKVKEILSSHRNRQYLSMARRVGNIPAKLYNIDIPEIELEKEASFAPPLFSLHDLKPNCLKTLRELPTVMPSNLT